MLEKAQHENQGANCQGSQSQSLSGTGQFLLQRRFRCFFLRNHSGHLAHLGLHSGCRYDSFCTTAHYAGTAEQHIFPIANSGFFTAKDFCALFYRN